ncbi:MAG: fatty acid desaturase [Gammaproteobacteria bacterium]|nr:fatty acid desaturase [Gammaproteobacteria bacterium]
MMPTTYFKQAEGLWFHGAAISYALGAYAAGLWGILFASSLVGKILATLALAHGMVIAAYLVHECGHNTIFRKIEHNARLGRFMSWICGASYGTFEDIRYKHFRHHADNDDVVWFDYEKFFREHPRTLAVTRVLEFFYIPAHCLLMHLIMVFTSFVIPKRRDQRWRNLTVIFIRGGLFLAMLVFAPLAALLYVIAYLILVHVLRFMDSLQHDYEYHTTLFSGERSEHRGDKEWEQRHTFSVPLSVRMPALNWLTLNFGYHNAHHANPNAPWYRLPQIHKELYADDPGMVIPLGVQLKICHRGRVERILKWDDESSAVPTPRGAEFLQAARAGKVTGGNAASFLTSF